MPGDQPGRPTSIWRFFAFFAAKNRAYAAVRATAAAPPPRAQRTMIGLDLHIGK